DPVWRRSGRHALFGARLLRARIGLDDLVDALRSIAPLLVHVHVAGAIAAAAGLLASSDAEPRSRTESEEPYLRRAHERHHGAIHEEASDEHERRRARSCASALVRGASSQGSFPPRTRTRTRRRSEEHTS